MTMKTKALALALGCSLATGLSAHAAEYEKSPGYVDFGDLKQYANGEESIEVFLAPPLLGLIEAIIDREEPELAGMIQELLLVKVDVFSFDRGDVETLKSVADRVASDLGGKGWQRLVKVQQRDERVLLYVLPTTEEREGRTHQLISGVVVVVLGGEDLNLDINLGDDDDSDADRTSRRRRDHYDDNEAVFVNIVGSFDIEAIGELMQRFDVPHVRGHIDHWDDRSDDPDDER